MLPLLAVPQIALAETAVSTVAAPTPADVSSSSEDDEAINTGAADIVVIGSRLAGQVDASQPPLMTLNEADIATYGAGSITELIAALGPQATSGRGRGGMPILLINGQRISNHREMRGISPEAIRRMEVLPEEVALRYGYPANARVINFILKKNFASTTIDGEYHVPTLGGFASTEAQFSMMRINGASRISINLYAEDDSPLFEAERGVIQTAAAAPAVSGDPDPAAFRSLIADSRNLGASGTWTTGLGKDGFGGSLSLNASYARRDSLSFSGLDTVVLTAPGGASVFRTFADPLQRVSSTDSFEGGAALNSALGSWQLSITADGSHAISNSTIDRRADTSALVAAAAAGTLPITGPLPALTPAGVDRARSVTDSATTLLTLAGRPLRLPAGEVSATVKAGFAHTGISSTDTRRTGGPSKLTRGDASAGLNLSLPIASHKEGALGGLGELSLNFSAGLNHLSDFGTLKDWSAGLTWAPVSKLNLQASYLVNEAAPSLGNLGDPAILTLNVPVYDFARGENVLVSVLSGGNPALLREKQRDLKLSANWEMPFIKDSSLLVEYFNNRSDDVTAAFPLLTSAIEAAYPGRAVRDAQGRLISIDRRAITIAETRSARLRWGLTFSGTIGKAAPGGAAGPRAGGFGPPRGAGGPGGAPSGGMGRGGGPGMGAMMAMMGGGPPGGGQGRWRVSVFHTVRFTDRVLIAPGGQVLDLLGGDALSGGGTARHALEFEGGPFYRGFGMRFNGSWAAPTRIKASGAPGTSDLRFGSVFNMDMRIFANLGQQKRLTDRSAFFKGLTVAIEIDNLFNSRQKVTDSAGLVPLSYQPDYMDPRGRRIGIDIRKTF